MSTGGGVISPPESVVVGSIVGIFNMDGDLVNCIKLFIT